MVASILPDRRVVEQPTQRRVNAVAFGLPQAVAGVAGKVSLICVADGPELAAHVMEYGYQKTGLRREGLCDGLHNFVEKLAFAAEPLTLGILLSTMGFVLGPPRTAT